jgi:5-methylcytosine-specific restriction endonuclease McrA
MLKVCKKCGEEKELEKFVKSQGAYRDKCKECKNKARRTGKPVGNKGIFRSRGKGGRYDCKFRKEIIERDGHKCTRCGSTETLHVHHIVPWKASEELRFEPSNVITLCDACHAIIEPKLPKITEAWNKGKKGIYSEETKKIWSEQRKGRRAWNKGLIGYRAGTKRKPHSEETKKKIRETKKGKSWTEKRRKAQKT